MPKIPCRVESGPEGGRRGSRHVAEEKEAQDAAAISPVRVWAICRPSALSFPVNGLRPDRIPPLHISGPSPTHCARRLTACAEGAVPSVPARPAQGRGPEAGQGVQGAWGCPGPGPLPPRRAGDHARRPGSGRHPAAHRKAPAPSPFSARGPLPSPKTPKGPVSRRRPAPLRNQARHRQPMRPSAAGGTRAKRRRTTGPPRRTWAWRTGCCPHGPGCRRARAAGCWSPSHAPRA